MSEERTWVGWPPPRRWWVTTGVAVAVALCAGIAVGLATSGNSKKKATKPTAESTKALAAMTSSAFTASRVGVACQVAGQKLVCSRAGAGRATLTTSGKLKVEREAASIQGGPALAPGQDWASIGIRCTEESGGLRCVVEELARGFFVDEDGFVRR